MMWLAITVVCVLLLGALVFLVLQQGSFNARRSLEIDASPEAVFAAIVDLKSWPAWSPWLIHEPEAQIEYSDDYSSEGGWYSTETWRSGTKPWVFNCASSWPSE